MKIATFNINNIRTRLPNLLAWLAETEPDVVCLQELKSTDRQFPAGALEEAGYSAVWLGQSTWNGVAILSRNGTPVLVRYGLPGDPDDRQARYIEAAVDGVLICCLYAPNGNPQPGPKFDYKLSWNERLIAHAAELQATGVPVVLAGDFNIVPESRDIYPTRSYADNALVQPEPRRQYRSLLDAGWTDALRVLYPEETLYTFWDYRRNRWQRNAGLRLDHVLLSDSMRDRLLSGGVDRDVRSQDGASDHAPVWIEVRRKTSG